jgi:hypothetical protein
LDSLWHEAVSRRSAFSNSKARVTLLIYQTRAERQQGNKLTSTAEKRKIDFLLCKSKAVYYYLNWRIFGRWHTPE